MVNFCHIKNICSVRLLLPISIGCFLIPIFVQDLLNYIYTPILYFFGFYFILLNFPVIINVLYSHPIYIEHLEEKITDNKAEHRFKKLYISGMNIVVALLFCGFTEYTLVKGIKNKSVIEILAIIGGTQSLFIRTQNIVGNLLLNLCHCFKIRKNSMDNIIDDRNIPLAIL